ncbi:MAG TPA: hypothetical protein VFK57_20700 [Vicinamibacterales bacterium]|nr:hypothetical protein [Vicinamibacterales bacterium]
MRYALAVLFAGTFASGPVLAQAPAPPASPADPPAAAQPQAAAVPAPPAAAAVPRADSRRDEVRAMEVFLLQALRTGAQDLAKQLRVIDPTSAFVTGTGRARGFVLDGYGVFFDVDVPEMRQSVVWSAQMLDLEQQRQSLTRFLSTAPPEDPRRKIAETNLRAIERLMGGPAGNALVPNPTANAELAQGRVAATSVAPVAEGVIATPAAQPAVPPGPVALQQRDPDELYTESVKRALIDVMLRHGHLVKIADDEWLTVAASDSDGPQPSGQLDDRSRILLSIRGSDLSAFRAGRLTREEVQKKVVVREF